MSGFAAVAFMTAPILKLLPWFAEGEMTVSVWLILLASRFTLQTGLALTGLTAKIPLPNITVSIIRRITVRSVSLLIVSFPRLAMISLLDRQTASLTEDTSSGYSCFRGW